MRGREGIKQLLKITHFDHVSSRYAESSTTTGFYLIVKKKVFLGQIYVVSYLHTRNSQLCREWRVFYKLDSNVVVVVVTGADGRYSPMLLFMENMDLFPKSCDVINTRRGIM